MSQPPVAPAPQAPDAVGSQGVIPEGFQPMEQEAFMQTVGSIYVRPNASGKWDIGCLALPRHANRFGTVHGGMLATLVDYAIGLNLLDAQPSTTRLGTVSLNIDFISAGQIGEWLWLRVQVDKDHGRLRFCSCTMHGHGDRLILKASGVVSAATIPS